MATSACTKTIVILFYKPTYVAGSSPQVPRYVTFLELSLLLMPICCVQANGFYGSKGVSGRIPEGYTLLEQRFMKAVRSASREWPHEAESDWAALRGPGVQLSEWEREGWTYHAKGSCRSCVGCTSSLT